jgi:hypothetical protein
MRTAGDLTRTHHDRFNTKWKRRFGRIFSDPSWARCYFQLMICDPRFRQFIASAISVFLPKTSGDHRGNVEILQLVGKLRDSGSVRLDGLLTTDQLSSMQAYFAGRECYDPFRPEMNGFKDPDTAHRSCLHAYFPPADVAAAPHVMELANHPLVLGVVEEHFGVKPVIGNIQAWWLLHGFDATANTHEPYVQRPKEFHRDFDDFAELKLFVYLTNVNAEAGPHAFIRTSHKWRLPRGTRSLQLDDPAYPSRENLQLTTGRAGLAWLENSLTLHRGTIPTKAHRLMLVVTYTLLPIAAGPKRPLISDDRRNFDPYINRVLLG